MDVTELTRDQLAELNEFFHEPHSRDFSRE